MPALSRDALRWVGTIGGGISGEKGGGARATGAQCGRPRELLRGRTAHGGEARAENGERVKERLRVLIVDDHPIVRRGLRAMLEGEPWVEEVAEAATVAEAIKEAAIRQVHVVAMDVALPDGDGIDATRSIVRAHPETMVLVLTMADDEDIVVRAFEAGAHGYLLKDTDPETVIDSLRTVAAGGVVLGPRIGVAIITAGQRQPAQLPPPLDKLTPREYEMLTRLATGESNARIARHLSLSEKTVRNQLSRVFSKLEVTDRVQAALLARDMGVAE
ncbi:MAG: response regulator [Pseudonocardiaceae bacterium]